MTQTNTQIRMRRHPQGMVTPQDFETTQTPLPELKDGEVLVRNMVLSLDPYMRPRMDPLRSYVPPLEIGELMPGAAVGEVVQSREPALPEGAIVTGPLGWQTHAVLTRNIPRVRVLDPKLGPPSAALSVLGMPGVTAHYGLLKLADPQPGETVVVTAASGAVGSVVGQIAKIKGCRVVGIAGGPDKCRYVTEELGFDACVDYRAADFEQQLAAATPDYVNILFENVGGPVFDAVLNRVDVWLLLPGRPPQHWATGNEVPRAERPLDSRTPAVVLDLPPGTTAELLLRVRSAGAPWRSSVSSRAMPWRWRAASAASRTTCSRCSGIQGLSTYWWMPASLMPRTRSALSL